MPHGRQDGQGDWVDLLTAAALLLLSVLGALMIGLAPQAGQTQLAVIAAPWKNLVQTAEMIGAAGGVIVETGGLPNVIIAYSNTPGFTEALYRAGAWLVLDPILLRGCLRFGIGRDPTWQKVNSDA